MKHSINQAFFVSADLKLECGEDLYFNPKIQPCLEELWMPVVSLDSRCRQVFIPSQNEWFFLAHLSTTCSRGAFRVVIRPLCVINNFFKHLLLPNCWANLDETWQECSLGGPLQKLFTEFDSIKNSGCHGNEIEFFKQFFENLLL